MHTCIVHPAARQPDRTWPAEDDGHRDTGLQGGEERQQEAGHTPHVNCLQLQLMQLMPCSPTAPVCSSTATHSRRCCYSYCCRCCCRWPLLRLLLPCGGQGAGLRLLLLGGGQGARLRLLLLGGGQGAGLRLLLLGGR